MFLVHCAYSQECYLPKIPDIPGYKTLICDFHMHTVFSDGQVWPTVRVDEAWQEGVDAIAITDHLEYLPHKEEIRTDYNKSWQIAKEYAKKKDIIVIAGTEITKKMPPGHFNALFIKDASSILNQDYRLAIEEAANQGAFIIWDHPGWKPQQPDTMLWWNEHTELYENGWMHGIEVVNSGNFYPMAVNWAKEKNLTMISSSDQHAPSKYNKFDPLNHRSSTLVFVTERSEGGIRDALFNERTVAYNGKDLIGKEAFLKALLQQSVKIEAKHQKPGIIKLYNKSDLYFELILTDELYRDWEISAEMQPGFERVISLPAESSKDQISVRVTNMIVGYNETLKLMLSELISVNK